MKRIAGIVSVALSMLVAACSTAPQVGNGRQAFDSSVNANAATAERMARLEGCDPVAAANLDSTNGQGAEDYHLKCSNGVDMFAHCEHNQCELSRQSAVVAVPAVASYPAQTQTSNLAGSNAVAPAAVQFTPAQIAPVQMVPQNPVPAHPLRAVFAVGASVGGDDLKTEKLTNGSTVNFDAGQGAQFSLGLDYRINQEFSVQATVGYEIRDVTASNGSVRFSRYPIEFLGYYHLTNAWRIGGGVRFVETAQLIGTGVVSETIDYGDTVGAVIESEYLIGRNMGVKLRAVKENYTETGTSNKYSGNAIGVFFNLYY